MEKLNQEMTPQFCGGAPRTGPHLLREVETASQQLRRLYRVTDPFAAGSPPARLTFGGTDVFDFEMPGDAGPAEAVH